MFCSSVQTERAASFPPFESEVRRMPVLVHCLRLVAGELLLQLPDQRCRLLLLLRLLQALPGELQGLLRLHGLEIKSLLLLLPLLHLEESLLSDLLLPLSHFLLGQLCGAQAWMGARGCCTVQARPHQ